MIDHGVVVKYDWLLTIFRVSSATSSFGEPLIEAGRTQPNGRVPGPRCKCQAAPFFWAAVAFMNRQGGSFVSSEPSGRARLADQGQMDSRFYQVAGWWKCHHLYYNRARHTSRPRKTLGAVAASTWAVPENYFFVVVLYPLLGIRHAEQCWRIEHIFGSDRFPSIINRGK